MDSDGAPHPEPAPGAKTGEPQAGIPSLGERLTEEKGAQLYRLQRPRSSGAQLYRRLQEALARLLREVAAGQRLRLDSLLPLVDQMVTRDDLLKGPLSKIALGHGSPDNALSDHLLHVAILSLKMGKELGWEVARLRRLAAASLLHDVGMCLVPRNIRHKRGLLTSSERAVLRRHSGYGYQIIKALGGGEFEGIANAVRQEHEREDGSGYPLGLSGGAIDEMSKVIAVSDVYEALTSERPHRAGVLPNQAIKEMVDVRQREFSPRVLKAMLNQISIFPLGSLVVLNTGAIARVIEVHEDLPMHPTVQFIHGSGGEDDRVLSLKENPHIHIRDSVDEANLEKLQYALKMERAAGRYFVSNRIRRRRK